MTSAPASASNNVASGPGKRAEVKHPYSFKRPHVRNSGSAASGRRLFLTAYAAAQSNSESPADLEMQDADQRGWHRHSSRMALDYLLLAQPRHGLRVVAEPTGQY